jgi:dihydroorotase
MARLVIKNGRVIDPASGHDGIADVGIEDGRIAALGPNLERAGAEVMDASGLVVAPGFIDMHTHLREPGFEHAETIETGSRAAAAGGFTSVCCMPNTAPVNDSATVTSYIIERARRYAVVNVFPIGAITKGSAGEELSAIGSMKRAGAVAISDDGRPVMNARVMRRAMETAKSFGLPVIDHCEDLNLSAGGDMHEGLESVRLGLRGIPSASEDVMVARDILLAEATACRFHVAHISSVNAVGMVASAKNKGLAVTCEVTPHHFALADCDMHPYDSNYKMKPPLRGRRDVNAVLASLVSGTIDAIATDHAPHATHEKEVEFENAPNGITGLETALGLCLRWLHREWKLPLGRVLSLLSAQPAALLGLKGRGTLAVGSFADVVVFDPKAEWTYHAHETRSKAHNTPFDGWTMQGKVRWTISEGRIAYSSE